MAIKYEFPCYPGDTVWYIDGYNSNFMVVRSDKVEMVGFTTRSIRIKLRNKKDFGKTFTWGKNVFATRDECIAARDNLQEEKHNGNC